jgi:alkylhydroperoxidase family enzyme
MNSHAAAARCFLGDEAFLIDLVLTDVEGAPVSAKLKALLHVAAKVQSGGKNVTTGDVDNAKKQGATDREIHDTVLIAAAFCMFNRYVDGLNSFTPTDPNEYIPMGERMARNGYQPPK